MSRVDEIRIEIQKLNDELKSIQEECSHPKACLTKEYGSDTGIWCRYDDSYWTNFHCNLCDKRWTEEGSK